MGIVSSPRSHPGMIRAIFHYLAERDRDQIGFAELREVLAPSTLLEDTEGSIWRDSTSAAIELGLLERAPGDELRIGEFDLRDDVADEARFRLALRSAVFAPRNNDGLWADHDGGWSSAASREFSRIAAWMAERDLSNLDPSDTYNASRRSMTGPGGAKLIENPEQLRVYERWAEALGLAVSLYGARRTEVWPDFTTASADALEDIGDPGQEILATDLRAGLLHDLPVLSGGAWSIPNGDDSGDGPAMRHAVDRLVSMGLLDADERSDAPSIPIGFSGRRGTHFVRREEVGGRD